MLECDVVVVLIGSKMGNFTLEEFNLAWGQLKQGYKPNYLFVYVKEIPVSIKNISAFKDYSNILDLLEYIENKGQLYEIVQDSVDLIYKFKNQLSLIIEDTLNRS